MNESGDKIAPAPHSSLAFHFLFFLRFVQLGSTCIAGFIACYFVWWHDTLHDEVPFGLMVFIFTVRLLCFPPFYLYLLQHHLIYIQMSTSSADQPPSAASPSLKTTSFAPTHSRNLPEAQAQTIVFYSRPASLPLWG
jgi:hypothetical protein